MAEAKSAEKSESKEVATITVKAAALHKDMGEKIAQNMQGVDDAKEQISALTQNQRYMRQENIALVTLGIFEASKADDTITPADYISGSKAERQDMNTRLRIVFGFQNPDGSLTALGKRVLPDPEGDDTYKESPEGKRARSRSNNLATLFRKGGEAAVALSDASPDKVTYDPDNFTLKIEGGKLPKTIMGKEKAPLLLTGETRPGAQDSASFATLQDIAVRKHDPKEAAKRDAKKGKPTDVETMAKAIATDAEALAEACNVIITGCNAMADSPVSQAVVDTLENLVKHVNSFLDNAEVK